MSWVLCARRLLLWGAAVVCAWPIAGWAEEARMATYSSGGEAYFALSLRAEGNPPPRRASDVVIMFDTSASQQGEYRTRALEALQALLDSLGPNDRVMLMGVDLNAVPLSEGFVSPEGRAMQQALVQLRRRVPLGSTDMGGVTAAAAAQFDQARPDAARAIVYIGDGMSTANLIQTGELAALADQLVARRVSVTSFGIGPQRDDQVMAVLANLSGGMLIVDTAEASAQEVGERLAQFATAPVVWTEQPQFSRVLPRVYPRRALPLRYDRDSVYVGRIDEKELADPAGLEISVVVEGQAERLRWTVVPEAPHQDHAFLARLVKAAEVDGGLSLPTLGTEGLFALNWMVNAGANNLAALAQQALALGNLDQAERLAQEVLRSDPQHPQAETILNAVAKAREQGNKGGPRDVRLAHFAQPAGGAGSGPAAATRDQPDLDLEGQDGAFVEKVTKDIQVSTELLQTEVQVHIKRAREIMGTDPEAARNILTQLLDLVRKSVDVPGDVRAQLNRQIEEAIRAADREHVRVSQQQIAAQQAAAEAAAQAQINRSLYLTQQKVEQLMERFNALLDEERYRDAEDLADQAKQMLPESPEMTTAVLTARNVGYTKLMDQLRDDRHRGVVDSLYAVEVSHVPTPDEPPILYPPAEVWRDITERRRKYKAVDLSLSNPQRDRIKAALEEETEVDFEDTPIVEVIEYLSTKHEIPIFMHKEELEQNSTPVTDDTPVTLHVKNVKLKSALRLMLRPLEATYVIDEETDVLLITSKTYAETLLVTRVYPVADLVVPIVNAGLGGMGGMMGIGGGMGGMMGGMGGMGMGGMGGMGMGGMGGMGGGFFNVRPPFNNRFGVFDVADDLNLSGKQKNSRKARPTAQPKPQPEPRAARSQSVEPIRLTIEAGADPDQVWNDYFAQHSDPPVPTAVVRETARQLMRAEKFDHVMALIHAALRNGQSQPWMYEALGLAMEAAGRSAAEIERALMSAIDYGATPIDLLYLAQYMDRLGLSTRALKLCHQVSQMEPTRAEAYAYGLRIAQRVDDLSAIRWATVGVLSQAWPKEHLSLWQQAYDLAAATLQRLRSEGKGQEADAYERTLDEALVRDCVVVVSWTGEGDIDLEVEEPCGTVCSYRNPRTPGGGVMLGDSFTPQGPAGRRGSMEAYVCPQGFSGDYRVLVRRVWGKVTADRVTIDIYWHYNSKDARRLSKKVQLVEDEAVAIFDLPNGRRMEPLAQVQLANDVAAGLAVGREILAQQLNVLADPRVAASFAAAQRRRFGVPFGDPLQPLAGAVGYMPVIRPFPKGAMFSVTAVISADRRYVRVSPLPFFTGITEVNTFNFVTGQTGQGAGAGFGGFGAGGGAGGFGGFGGF